MQDRKDIVYLLVFHRTFPSCIPLIVQGYVFSLTCFRIEEDTFIFIYFYKHSYAIVR